ncbi:hypothetical protein J2Z83_002688 [Virgibacillus natechei]|uniref:Two-component sensor histidine kinase n=1 Tax=Virgibacillus natechei TaxID=1216297 RepID=A0ABS4IHY9_9BACI|nr:hypothetical protein [Virgibacillus natechei]MBP1970567.1 hypothetical protein [Virgibacillus natechei]UZD14033.1 hypothetical protein OLD84_05815 [Virgibacillus natechei]
MKGKTMVLIILIASILLVTLSWFVLEFIIDAYDIDRAMANTIETYIL